MLTFSAMALVLAASAPLDAGSTAAEKASDAGPLSVAALVEGRNIEAIAELEASGAVASDDPGQLINLGIAYAREGDDDVARAMFVAALTSSEPIELETADGSLTDSRRLARKALRMLDAGVFISAQPTERVTMRD